MSARRDLSLRTLLVLFAALGTLIVLLVTALVGMRVQDVRSTTSLALGKFEPAAEQAARLALAYSEMDRGVSLFLVGESEEDLRSFASGERQSAIALESLRRSLGQDPVMEPLIADVESAYEEWLSAVPRPAIKAARDGDLAAAGSIVTSDDGLQLADDLVNATATLANRIDSARSAAFLELASLTDQLVLVLIGSAIALLTAIFAAVGIMFRLVLAPVNSTRAQLREVTRRGNHKRPIVPVGPRELAAVGSDAESMRRHLVAEIDEARSAREALEHSAPLVTAIRRELLMPTDPRVSGVSVRGEVRPAEGVLAGDWWDCVAASDGTVSLLVTDVSGHGPEAGVAAMRLKHLLSQSLASGDDPSEALSLAARTFADDPGRFATTVVVRIDPANGIVRWANGGHHPPILLDADGNQKELGATGPLLSWLGGPWRVDTARMGRGDYLIMFSDGLVESHAADGSELGVEGLLTHLRKVRAGSTDPGELVERVLARARERAVDWERDDITLVIARLEPAADAAAAGSALVSRPRQPRGSQPGPAGRDRSQRSRPLSPERLPRRRRGQ